MNKEEFINKQEKAIRALAKELEGRPEMHGIVLEIIMSILKTIREEKQS